MKFKPSIIINDLSGSAKGVTAATGRGGSYLQKKAATKAKPNPSQQQTTAIMRSLQQKWKTLTADQCRQWNTAAQTQLGKTVLGVTTKLTGSNLYVRLNYWLTKCGSPLLITPPSLIQVETPSTATAVLNTASMQLTLASLPIDTTLKLVICASAPQSTGVNPGSKSISTPTIAGPMALPASASTPIDITAAYQTKYGTPPSKAAQIFLKYFYVSPVTGQKSQQAAMTAQYSPINPDDCIVTIPAVMGGYVTRSGATVQGQLHVNRNTTLTLTAVPRTNFGFKNWQQDGSAAGTTATKDFLITANTQISPTFQYMEPVQISTAVSPEGAGKVTGGRTYVKNSTASLNARANSGYRFVGWQDEPAQSSSRTVSAVADRTYTAVFEPSTNQPTLTVDLINPDLGTITPAAGQHQYNIGDSVTVQTTPIEGAVQISTFYDGDFQNNRYPLTINITRSATVQVVLGTIQEYQVTAQAVPAESCATPTITESVPIGFAQEFYLRCKNEYVFSHWSDDPYAPQDRHYRCTGPQTLYAHFKKKDPEYNP